MARDAGNRFSEALNVRLRNNGTRTLTDSLSGPNDQLDFYRIRLSRRSNLRVVLSGLEENANLALYDSDQVEIAASEQDDEDPETIAVQLGAGDYFIRVNQREDNTSYRIRFAASPDAANTFRGARRIDLEPNRPRGAVTLSDGVDSADDRLDYYRFELVNQSSIEAVLDRLGGNVDLRLFNGRGRQIGISNRAGRRSESIERDLDPGVYFLRANVRGQGSASYRLRLSFTSNSNSLFANRLSNANTNTAKSGIELFY